MVEAFYINKNTIVDFLYEIITFSMASSSIIFSTVMQQFL